MSKYKHDEESMFKWLYFIHIVGDLIARNQRVLDNYFDSNVINGIGLNLFTIQVKIDYAKTVFDTNHMYQLTETRRVFWVGL